LGIHFGGYGIKVLVRTDPGCGVGDWQRNCGIDDAMAPGIGALPCKLGIFGNDEVAIESPFYGKNVQSMLKLGRAQGVAIAAAISRDIPIFEYAPLKIKMSITGNGRAAKEQVAYMLQKILHIPDENMLTPLDATDGLAAALCHFYQSDIGDEKVKYKNWKDFAKQNRKRIKGL
jgi:crossover junction endodeoxyribonuclease RuvC